MRIGERRSLVEFTPRRIGKAFVTIAMLAARFASKQRDTNPVSKPHHTRRTTNDPA